MQQEETGCTIDFLLFFLSSGVVTPAVLEPLPGWVDNLNGPTGILVGAGKGVIRSMLCETKYHAEVIPVDFAINALILMAQVVATKKK